MLQRVDFPGLDGSNLLGYMAALGTLRVLTLADPECTVRMSWSEEPGWWMPAIWHSKLESAEDVTSALVDFLGGGQALVGYASDYLDLGAAEFASYLADRVELAKPNNRYEVDFLAAMASELFESDGKISTTEFRAIGAGNNEGFLGYMRTIHASTSRLQIQRALFSEWDYADDSPFMRWDPNEFRPHALRAKKPAGDTKRNSMRGANRLAIESLPLFPVMPTVRGLRTTAFDRAASITYPVWLEPLDCATVASVLAIRELQVERPDRTGLHALGIGQVFRAERFTEGKYRNFSPSRALL